jgi:hypothetical protein
VKTSAGAIDFLERDPGGESERRADAVRTLAGAIHGASESTAALRSALDVALARAPRALELRRTRALLDRSASRPIQADDLAAVASASGAAKDLEDLLAHAATAGLTGADAPEVARSLWLAHRESRSGALVFAFAAAGLGDASHRGEIVEALHTARSTQPQAQALERALADVDRVAEHILAGQSERESSESAALIERLRVALPPLARRPGLERAPAVVLEPLGPALRTALGRIAIADAISSQRIHELVNMLEAVDEPSLPLPLLVLREVLKLGANYTDQRTAPFHGSSALFEAAGRSLEVRDPLLAAYAFLFAATNGEPKIGLEHARAVAEAARPFELQRRAGACEEAFERGAVTSVETTWCYYVKHRQASGTRSLWWRLSVENPTADDRTKELEEALRWARRAFELSVTNGSMVSLEIGVDAGYVIDLALELDCLDENEPALAQVPGRSRYVLPLEILRIHGKAELALQRGAALLPRTPDAEAVCALAAIDLGREAEARMYLDRLDALEKQAWTSPVSRFRGPIVRGVLDARKAAR